MPRGLEPQCRSIQRVRVDNRNDIGVAVDQRFDGFIGAGGIGTRRHPPSSDRRANTALRDHVIESARRIKIIALALQLIRVLSRYRRRQQAKLWVPCEAQVHAQSASEGPIGLVEQEYAFLTEVLAIRTGNNQHADLSKVFSSARTSLRPARIRNIVPSSNFRDHPGLAA